jgi:hypothetical protein
MDVLLPLGAIVALLLLTTVVGFAWRATRGRSSLRSAGEHVDAAGLGLDRSSGWGRRATLLQFSTVLCSTCPQTRRVLSAVAAAHPGVGHVDVDVSERPDLVRRFALLQTPTTLLLDADGTVRVRWGGAVRPALVTETLAHLVEGHAR